MRLPGWPAGQICDRKRSSLCSTPPETPSACFCFSLSRGDVRLGMSSHLTRLAAVAIENTLLYERLAFQAQHDVLTGLPNRLLFQDRVQQSILRAQRNRRKLAVLWFDLDRFKQINDTLGHRVGDELLSEFGRRLRSSLRESDTAARVGGDEFVVLAGDLEAASDAQIIAAKIMGNIRMPMIISGHQLTISASAGISIYSEHGADPAALMRSADTGDVSGQAPGPGHLPGVRQGTGRFAGAAPGDRG